MVKIQDGIRKLFLMFCLLVLAAVVANAQTEPALEIGALAFAGAACVDAGSDPSKIQVDQGHLQIPVEMRLKKITGESFRRGACAFTLPVQAPQGYRVSISQLMAPGYVNLAQGVRGQINLEVFKSGSKGEQLVFEERAENGRLRKTILFEKPEQLFETECGEGFNLRGNASFLMAEGAGRSTMSLDLIQLKVELVKCEAEVTSIKAL